MATKAQNFAQNVRAWMKVRGLTLQDTAEQTGIDYRLLQRWASKGVSRRSRATEKEFLLLANAMGFYERRAHWLFWELNESWSKRSPIARPPALMELLEQVESVVRFGKMTTRSEMLSAIRKAHEATVNEIKEREKPSPFQIDEMRWIDDRKKDDPRNQIDSAPDPPARTSSTPPFKLDPLAQQRGESDATKSSKPVKARAKTTHRTIVKWTGSKRRQAAENPSPLPEANRDVLRAVSGRRIIAAQPAFLRGPGEAVSLLRHLRSTDWDLERHQRRTQFALPLLRTLLE